MKFVFWCYYSPMFYWFINLAQQFSFTRTTKSVYAFVCGVLTAPHMEHGTQWAGRGQSSATMLPANLLTQLILPLQCFLPPSLPCIPTTREKSTSTQPCLVLIAAGFVLKVAVEAHSQLTVLWPQSRTCAPFEKGLSLSQTCITREAGEASLEAGAKKKGKWNNAETTQEHHREEGHGEEGTGGNNTSPYM